MDDGQFTLIISELRDLRADFSSFARDTGERVATLESHDHNLYGNGQPGRVAMLERAVEELKRWRWWMVGAAAGGGGVISAVAWLVEFQSKR